MRYALLVIFLFYSTFANSQQRREDTDFSLFAYNVGFGGITAGIGAIINKPKDTPVHKAFLNGFYQGCFGGMLQYGGKKLAYQIVKRENYWYGWSAKLVHNAGASIVENAAMSRPFGRYWNIDLGPLRFDFVFNTEDDPFRVRVSPMIIYDIIAIGVQSNSSQIDWGKSLKMGTLVFYTNESLYGYKRRQDVVGTAYSKSFIYTSQTNNIYKTNVHELVHLFQYREHLVLSVCASLEVRIGVTYV